MREFAPFSFTARRRPMAPWPAARKARHAPRDSRGHTQEHTEPQCCLNLNFRCKLKDCMDCKDSTHALGALGGQHGQSAHFLSRVARLLRRRLCQHLWLTTVAAVANYFCCCDSMDRMNRRSPARDQSASLAPRAAPPLLVPRAVPPRGPIRVTPASAGALACRSHGSHGFLSRSASLV